jgi:putative intracellular protease/amidase
MMTKVLMVISAADRWTLNDGTVHPSGYWAEEVAVPYGLFSEAGWDITVATPGGKAPTLDQLSLGISGGLPWKRRGVKRYLDSIQTVLEHPVPLDTVNPDDFEVVFYPGGHGPMEDLAYDRTSGALLTHRLASGRPLALLCHAPAAILAATGPDGKSPFAGRRMTGLSNREELLNRFAKKAPWLLEDKLKEAGVVYSKGFPLRPHTVVDGNLYTGQNPQSSEKLAERLVADVRAASSS